MKYEKIRLYQSWTIFNLKQNWTSISIKFRCRAATIICKYIYKRSELHYRKYQLEHIVDIRNKVQLERRKINSYQDYKFNI